MKEKLILFLKGMAMGAADVVPGVSGGTVALVAGVYDQLLTALSNIPNGVLLLLRGDVKRAWQVAHANFLLTLFAGILISIFSFAGLITWLLETQPIVLWSFFFGLILVSCYMIARDIQCWSWSRWLLLIAGISFAWWITMAAPIAWGHDPLSLFAAGAIAICAMILPGISGSFILVLMGLYPAILLAVKQLDLGVLVVFAGGCLFGILAFARLLKAALERFSDLTLALLTGIMFGSLNKIWPWKHTLTWSTDSQGVQVPVLQENILPWTFSEISQTDAQLLPAVLLAIFAVLFVLGLERYARQSH